MAGRKVIRTVKDLVQYILEITQNKNIEITSLEEKSNISQGCISRWNRSSPRLSNVLSVLGNLGIDVILIDTSEPNNTLELNIDLSALDSEYLKEFAKISTDAKMLYLITQIFKEPNLTVSDKERLCNILEAFL